VAEQPIRTVNVCEAVDTNSGVGIANSVQAGFCFFTKGRGLAAFLSAKGDVDGTVFVEKALHALSQRVVAISSRTIFVLGTFRRGGCIHRGDIPLSIRYVVGSGNVRIGARILSGRGRFTTTKEPQPEDENEVPTYQIECLASVCNIGERVSVVWWRGNLVGTHPLTGMS
jgi:hypothetical protein